MKDRRMAYRLGIDIGGTFTDFALLDEEGGSLSLYKELTTPDDPSDAVLRGAAALLRENGVAMRDIRVVDHATTLVTNAIIERKGVPTAMLATEGFEDVLDIGEERRYDLYDLRLRFPGPIVPRRLRRPVSERMHYSGTPVKAPDIDGARRVVQDLVDRYAVRSLAVCLLHSYANPEHENQVIAMVREAFPYLYVCGSADVLPFMREYHRWTTTTINAYVQPIVDKYLARLEEALATQGFSGQFHIMTSSGGSVTLDAARRYPVRLLESGPAAGALMSAFHGRTLGIADVLSFDMGGTTAKGALVRGGKPLKKYGMEIARAYQFKAGSGYPVRVPTIDMIEIGAGGGSIAELDERGLIRVGPRSAGASPGPVCYGRGGIEPTLTDANLLLGYLDPLFFLGGRMRLDVRGAERAIMERVGRPLGLELVRAAWGIHEIINEDVARAFRVHASERGFDYRRSSMVAFGGCGPMHAVRIARKLGVPRVILPASAGVMSALGLLISPLSFETVRSLRMDLAALDKSSLQAAFRPLVDQVSAFLEQAGVRRNSIHVVRKLDMRYEGQGHEVEVSLPEDGDQNAVREAFDRTYRSLFSSFLLHEPLEIINWKVEAFAPRVAEDHRFAVADTKLGSEPVKGRRDAYFPEAGESRACEVYDRYLLAPGMRIDGPALIEERESTCVIGPGDSCEVDGHRNLLIDVGREDAA